jgi:hypothetical protein
MKRIVLCGDWNINFMEGSKVMRTKKLAAVV